jgi:hypothetical protein
VNVKSVVLAQASGHTDAVKVYRVHGLVSVVIMSYVPQCDFFIGKSTHFLLQSCEIFCDNCTNFAFKFIVRREQAVNNASKENETDVAPRGRREVASARQTCWFLNNSVEQLRRSRRSSLWPLPTVNLYCCAAAW